jgi:hypothetical protein
LENAEALEPDAYIQIELVLQKSASHSIDIQYVYETLFLFSTNFKLW